MMDRQAEQASSLTYVADPMCSWCYAFGPELERVLDVTGLPIQLVMGGLFVGDQAPPLDDELRSYLRLTWARVKQMSGRPVDHGLLRWTDWTYDTEPACRAVVAVRDQRPGATHGFFDRLQEGFYAENLDLTRAQVLGSMAAEMGLDGDAVARAVGQPVAGARAPVDDFVWAKDRGIRGFPTLLLTVGPGPGPDGRRGPGGRSETVVVAAGFKRADPVIRTITTLIPDP